jgi:hypothetical protein
MSPANGRGQRDNAPGIRGGPVRVDNSAACKDAIALEPVETEPSVSLHRVVPLQRWAECLTA